MSGLHVEPFADPYTGWGWTVMTPVKDRTILAKLERQDIQSDIHALCSRLGVVELDIFGSAASGSMTNSSDIDVLVTFSSDADDLFSRYFALKEELESLLGRPVDVVTAASIRNPYFRTEVEKSRVNVYSKSSRETSL